MRPVVDTNVWISAVLNPAGRPGSVRQALVDRQFTLVMSDHLLTEIKEVLTRPRFSRRYKIVAADIDGLTVLLCERAEIAAVTGAVRLCRGPDDDMVIEAARVGRADALVTRDDDLKRDWDLVRILLAEGIQVLSVTRFLEAVV